MVDAISQRINWLTEALRESDARGAQFFLHGNQHSNLSLYRIDDGVHTLLGTVWLGVHHAYWTPDPEVKYVDVPEALHLYEDKRAD